MGNLRMQFRSAFQINAGFGAGNIADTLAVDALWHSLPADLQLHVGMFPPSAPLRIDIPPAFTAHLYSPPTIENAWVRDIPGLLAAVPLWDGPLDSWPTGVLAPRLQHFHDRGLPVDAAGVFVDRITSPEGRALFAAHFSPIRSWSVTDAASVANLLELGVDQARISLGADWGWLHPATNVHDEWAASAWLSLGIDPDQPLLVVNASWNFPNPELSRALAAALDTLHAEDGFQLAFLCLESRHPGFHRSAAELVQSFLQAPSALVPNEFYSPAELIALLRHATLAVTRHQPFAIAAVLADTLPFLLPNSVKGPGVSRELGFPPYGELRPFQPDPFVDSVRANLATRASTLAQLTANRAVLSGRARHNLDAFRLFHGYANSASSPAETVFP
jgi:hypothetical protein